MSYLSVPVHPLDDYRTQDGKSLRYTLYSYIIGQGRFGMYEKPDRIGMMSSGVLGKIYEFK